MANKQGDLFSKLILKFKIFQLLHSWETQSSRNQNDIKVKSEKKVSLEKPRQIRVAKGFLKDFFIHTYILPRYIIGILELGYSIGRYLDLDSWILGTSTYSIFLRSTLRWLLNKQDNILVNERLL